MADEWAKFLDEAKIPQLKSVLAALGLALSGNKAALRARIEDAVKDMDVLELVNMIPGSDEQHMDDVAGEDSEDIEQSEDNIDELQQEIENLRKIAEKKRELLELRKELKKLEVEDIQVNSRSAGCSFKDIEDSVPAFSGDDTYPIQRWINQFEESAEILGFDEKIKFIYSKRLLTGTAKLLMRSTSLKSWEEVKNALLKEFSRSVSCADIHKELRERKKRREETFQQYVFYMQEIASSVSINEEDLMNYIIQGIPDNEINKVILYSANNMNELKIASKKYEKIKVNTRNTHVQQADSYIGPYHIVLA